MNAPLAGPLEETLTLRQAKKLIQCMAHEQSFLLLSPPGVGKSEMVYQAAAEANLPCRSLLGTQIAPEDVSGIPRIVGERSVFCPPRVLLPEKPEPFCLFLDELPACAPAVPTRAARAIAHFAALRPPRHGGVRDRAVGRLSILAPPHEADLAAEEAQARPDATRRAKTRHSALRRATTRHIATSSTRR